MNPQLGQKPDQLSPDLQKATHVEALGAARDAVALAFGVLPSMLAQSAQGNAIREGQRHLAVWTIQPIAGLMAEEASAKLSGSVSIDVMRNLQAFDTGGRARALKTIITQWPWPKRRAWIPRRPCIWWIGARNRQDAPAFVCFLREASP